MKHTFSRLFIAAAVSTILAACGGETKTETTQQPAAPASAAKVSSASQVALPVTADTYVSPLPASAPVVNVVTTGRTLPFSFTGENGQVIGMDVDVIRKIGEAAGFKVQFHKQPWVKMFESIDSGEMDLAISGISYTDERAGKYALSDSYAVNPSSLMFMREDLNGKIKGLDDLGGLTVGVLGESKHHKQLTASGKAKEVRPYQTTYLLFTSLIKQEVDVIAQDSLLLNQLAKEHADYKVFSVNYEKDSEPSAQLVILANKNNAKLRDSVNEGLAKIKQDGTLTQIETQWLKN